MIWLILIWQDTTHFEMISSLSFREDFMPFILKWAKVSLALKCLDCSPSCQPQNDNNIFVIKNWKCHALESHRKGKIISNIERNFFAWNDRNFKKNYSRKKTLKTLIIPKRQSISIDFLLLCIRKRESALDCVYFQKTYIYGQFSVIHSHLSAIIRQLQ